MPRTQAKSPRPRPPFARLEARISPEQKELIQKAAALEGRTLTDFVVGCVVREARRVVRENEAIGLSKRDREVFVAALLNPPAPGKALLKAATSYARQVGGEP